MYRTRETTENIVVLSVGSASEDMTAWDVECLYRDLGVNGIGAHYVILRDGDVLNKNTYKAIRARDEVGNVDPRYNANSIFVVLVGSDDQYTEGQRAALNGLIGYLQEQYPEVEPLFHTIV
ncbi:MULTISPECIES: N-acetylmuramoyl-L-alanine amidase [unclassified Marinobacter]|uniref:N-acetylmuramoyl-L-alanine amidase n=1 Tax=unclassified Marinobacter TaxID=83889 RepID=UPI0012686122|nr:MULTISPECIES: N-acetylmuramoyl-L-alanine amidase [unclassified Marinobacter]QFS87604.1 N-acetylmuramoyl-L-alanine amidase [Marinobacter sp. THAF197a]QFT51389.1 N-acetylmuramoyl-L-alanine amidase [Marinobacter sp. THAF39]